MFYFLVFGLVFGFIFLIQLFSLDFFSFSFYIDLFKTFLVFVYFTVEHENMNKNMKNILLQIYIYFLHLHTCRRYNEKHIFEQFYITYKCFEKHYTVHIVYTFFNGCINDPPRTPYSTRQYSGPPPPPWLSARPVHCCTDSVRPTIQTATYPPS